MSTNPPPAPAVTPAAGAAAAPTTAAPATTTTTTATAPAPAPARPPVHPSSSSWREKTIGSIDKMEKGIDKMEDWVKAKMEKRKAKAAARAAAGKAPTGKGDKDNEKEKDDEHRDAVDKANTTGAAVKVKKVTGTEEVDLFPGWAAKHFDIQKGDEFSVQVAISGYAAAFVKPDEASRSQKAFLSLAKGFAALPKLADHAAHKAGEAALAAGEAMKSAGAAVQQQLGGAPTPTAPPAPHPHPGPEDFTDTSSSSSSSDSSRSSSPEPIPGAYGKHAKGEATNPFAHLSPAELARFHANLDARLERFLSRPAVARTVRLSVYLAAAGDATDAVLQDEPLVRQEVVTAEGGAFGLKTEIPFEVLSKHSKGVHVAFGDLSGQHALLIVAELLPAAPPAASGAATPEPAPAPVSNAPPATRIQSQIVLPLTYAPIRLVSDIDDTIKVSEILRGARTVFRNVFVKDLQQVVIDPMSAWYQGMATKGVRFHYVSNSPFELLTPLAEFINVAKLPPGSLKLKYYGGKSLFKGLFEPAGERKRAGVVEVLDAFPGSVFILVGDTGEQDMELYSSLAHERPSQVAGVFIRDVTTDPKTQPPVVVPAAPLATANQGAGAVKASRSTTDVTTAAAAGAAATLPAPPHVERANTAVGTVSADPAAHGVNPVAPPVRAKTEVAETKEGWLHRVEEAAERVEAEVEEKVEKEVEAVEAESLELVGRRRAELGVRVEKARELIPRHVAFRVFRDPSECVEAVEIVEKGKWTPPADPAAPAA